MFGPEFEQDLKKAGVTIEQFRKMTMRQRLDLNLPKRDWREGWMGDTDIPSHREMPDVIIGFHNKLPAQPSEERRGSNDRPRQTRKGRAGSGDSRPSQARRK
jgi:hypothetical protein